MANIEKIQGSAVLKLFKELHQDNTPLKMQLINTEYERLTHIAKIRKWKRVHYFLIEYHENFRIVADDLDGWRMRFEFACKDNINYSFEENNKIKLDFIVEILNNGDDVEMKVNKALHELDEIADDANLQAYTRTRVWNIASLLEGM